MLQQQSDMAIRDTKGTKKNRGHYTGIANTHSNLLIALSFHVSMSVWAGQGDTGYFRLKLWSVLMASQPPHLKHWRFLLVIEGCMLDIFFPQDCWLCDPFLYRNIWKSCGTTVSNSVSSKNGNRRKEVSKVSVRFWSLLQKDKYRITQCSYFRLMLA